MTMMHSVRAATAAGFVVAAAALAGCAAGSGFAGGKIETVPPGDERIVFAAPVFAGTTPQRGKFADYWEREEYALFRGGGAQAEIIYSTVLPGPQVALQYDFTLERMVETWNVNRTQAKIWSDAQRVRTPLGEFFYKPYTLAGGSRACFGFANEWDDPADDPWNRPGKVLFGYYCAKAGRKISLDEMEDLIRTIGVRGITEPIRKSETARAAGAPVADATLIAKGPSASADRGNMNFPFRFAEHFQIGNGDEKKP